MYFAMYTIRSKQDYIYRTNRVVEIVGASENISRAWDCLFEQAEKKAGLQVEQIKENTDEAEPFQYARVEERFAAGQLDMVELFRGGGNDHVMFRNRDCYVKANKAFSFYVLQEYPGMIPMAVGCEVTGDYRRDYATLMELSDVEKNRMIPGRDTFILPFSMMNRVTFQPMTDIIGNGCKEPITRENLAKRKTGQKCSDKDKAVKLLGSMVNGRGQESMRAVVHADGNNMGCKIMELLGNQTDYDFCINAMRRFTRDTAAAFVREGLAALEQCRKQLIRRYQNKGNARFAYRTIIADGDDITFICNARFVMDYVKAYTDAVWNYQKKYGSEWRYSSCVGICIFHSYFPFAKAYQLAEEACDDGAKTKVHIVDEDGNASPVEECWMDFHYIHNGISGDLVSMREQQGTASCMARPWRIDEDAQVSPLSYSRLEELVEICRECNVSRGDIKSLGIEWEISKEDAYISWKRICGRHRNPENERLDLERRVNELGWQPEFLMKAMYDLAEVYDLWFGEE